MPGSAWATDVVRFCLEDTAPEKRFQKDDAFDAAVGARFARAHAYSTRLSRDDCLTDPQTALAAVIVLDQFSRNMFRGTPRAFASNPQALRLAAAAIARGFDRALPEPARVLFYLPFEHAEDAAAQARCVALMATLAGPSLMTWAEARKAIIDRFGRFPIATPHSAANRRRTNSTF